VACNACLRVSMHLSEVFLKNSVSCEYEFGMARSSGERVVRGILCLGVSALGDWRRCRMASRDICGVWDGFKREEDQSLLDGKMESRAGKKMLSKSQSDQHY